MTERTACFLWADASGCIQAGSRNHRPQIAPVVLWTPTVESPLSMLGSVRVWCQGSSSELKAIGLGSCCANGGSMAAVLMPGTQVKRTIRLSPC